MHIVEQRLAVVDGTMCMTEYRAIADDNGVLIDLELALSVLVRCALSRGCVCPTVADDGAGIG